MGEYIGFAQMWDCGRDTVIFMFWMGVYVASGLGQIVADSHCGAIQVCDGE